MKRYKNIIFLVALCIFAYLQINLSRDSDLINLYYGTVFNGIPAIYVRWFLLFACYCLYTYNEFETYIKQYGIILVTREQSRNRLMLRLTARLLRLILQIEVMKIICYMVFTLIIRRKLTVSNPAELIKMIVINILVFLLILFLQMIIEIYFSGNTAVCISLAYFILGLGISDFVERSTLVSRKLNLIFLPNLVMKIRLDELIKDRQMHIAVIGILIVLIISTYLFFTHQFRKKDLT